MIKEMISNMGTTIKSVDDFFQNLTDEEKEIAHTFTFAALHLESGTSFAESEVQRKANHITLLEGIPEYRDVGGERNHQQLLSYWISEVIQNGLDAGWGNQRTSSISISLDNLGGSPRLKLRHDGRPPQYIANQDKPNELVQMIIQGGTKRSNLLLEGMFGIGFKIWYKLFNRIELRAEHLQVEISTYNDDAPSIKVSELDHEIDGFEIEVIEVQDELLETIESIISDSENLQDQDGLPILDRTVQGMILRPHPTEVDFLVNGQPVISVSQTETVLSDPLKERGFRLWDSVQHHGSTNTEENSSITFSKKIVDLFVADEVRNHIEKVKENTPGSSEDDIDYTVQQFQVHLSIDRNISTIRPNNNPLFCSMFPITRKGTREMLDNLGLTFVTHFGLDNDRKYLHNSEQLPMEKNRLLLTGSLELFFTFLSELSDLEVRSELGISEERYIELLGFLSPSHRGTNHQQLIAYMEFVNHVWKDHRENVEGKQEPQYLKHYPEICDKIFSIKFLPQFDGNLLSYYQGIPLREGLEKLLNHTKSEIAKIAREQLLPSEVVVSDSNGTMVPVKWWSIKDKNNFESAASKLVNISDQDFLEACIQLFQGRQQR
jgi:hypothetical protein